VVSLDHVAVLSLVFLKEISIVLSKIVVLIYISYQNKHGYIQTYVEHIFNSETTAWNSGEKRKRMVESQQY
jgi:hypothetical protein